MQIYNFFGIFAADMMKKTLITVFFMTLSLFICGQSEWKSRTIVILDSLCADPLFETSQLGLAVWDLTDDSLVYAVGYRQRLRPASCQKVITAVTALKSLGAGFSFRPYVREAGWGWCWDDKITTPDVDGEPLLNDTAVWTLNDVLQPMLKKSDNLMADLSLNPKDYLIADGSGLSLYDYVTVELLVRVLRYAWQWDHIRIPFIEALPIAGIDGTLEKRMIRTSAHGNVRAKTGTVEGVSSLAGYCRTSEGHFLCYAIINQGIVRARTGRDFQDSICVALTRK